MNTILLASATLVLSALGASAPLSQTPERPTATWVLSPNEDLIVDADGVLHTANLAVGDTEKHAYATLQLPIPQKARGFEISFDLKLGQGESVPVVFEARAGNKKPLQISFSGADDRCRIFLAGNEISHDPADKEWHSFKLTNAAGRLALYRDRELIGALNNKIIPDLLRFGGDFGVKGKQSEAWLRLVSAKFATPADMGKEIATPDKVEGTSAPKDQTPLLNAAVSLEVTDLSNPKGPDPTVEKGSGSESWHMHITLSNLGYTPVNYYDFGPAWIKFDNYQSVSGVPYIWDPGKGKGIYRAAKRSECWLPPGQTAEVFYYFNGSDAITGKPVRVEFVSGGIFKYAIPPP